MTIYQVKEDIYNYYINDATKYELLIEKQPSLKISTTYSDMPKCKGITSDSVSSEVERLLMLDTRIKKLNDKLCYIDDAMPLLDEFEWQIINYIKRGYKMSIIASRMNCSKGKIRNARDKGIQKIYEFANNKTL